MQAQIINDSKSRTPELFSFKILLQGSKFPISEMKEERNKTKSYFHS